MIASDRVKAHLEEFLGPLVRITAGHRSEDGEEAACHVATFVDQPVEGAFTLVTVGLSDAPLTAPEGEKIRQELLFCAWDEDLDDRLYSLLLSTAQVLRESGETANAGDLIDLDEPLSNRGDLRHVFLYPPTYHPDEIETVPGGSPEDDVEILWLIPVTAEEVRKIREEGPDAFEQYLAANDPDLLDLGREDQTDPTSTGPPSLTR